MAGNLGPVARSLVRANHWLRGIKTDRFPWYLTLVSAVHASSNPGLVVGNERRNDKSCTGNILTLVIVLMESLAFIRKLKTFCRSINLIVFTDELIPSSLK